MMARYQVLRRRILSEREQIRRAATKAQKAYQAAAHGGQNETFYLDSTALNLHGFYNGVERLLEIVAREIDDSLPSGPTWHRDLLQQMQLDVPDVRPAVLAPMTVQLLEEYLGFRHIVRNLCTWDFMPTKLGELISRVDQTLAALDRDFVRFDTFLENAVQAD